MKFVKYSYSAGYCGTDEETYAKWDDDATDDEIANYGEELAWNHVNSYGAQEEWEEENPDIEFELDYGYEYIKEEDKPEDYKWEDCCKSA